MPDASHWRTKPLVALAAALRGFSIDGSTTVDVPISSGSIWIRVSRLLISLQREAPPFRTEFNRVTANLDHGEALNRISLMSKGERSTIDLDEGKAPVRFG